MKSSKLTTASVHAGAHVPVGNRPEAFPIYQTSVFTFDDLDDVESFYSGASAGTYLYSRMGNPNCTALEEAVAGLEEAEAGVVTSSGMSAILCALLAYVQAGDHVLCSDEVYGTTALLLQNELQRLGVECSFVSCHEESRVAAAFRPNTKAVLAEVVTNPLISVIDIAMLARLAHEREAKLIVDNTFTTPYLIRPLHKGADLVIHSATKYLNGHNDVTAGVIVGSKADIEAARQRMIVLGCNLGPFEAWLVSRGLKTFALRLKQHNENAAAVAEYLQEHPKVKTVYYPRLERHRTYPVARSLELPGGGGMLSVVGGDDMEKLNKFFRTLEMIDIAPSLAGVATTLSHPLKTSHRFLTPERQRELGIVNGLLRLSVGIEDVQDILADLEKGLAVL